MTDGCWRFPVALICPGGGGGKGDLSVWAYFFGGNFDFLVIRSLTRFLYGREPIYFAFSKINWNFF